MINPLTEILIVGVNGPLQEGPPRAFQTRKGTSEDCLQTQLPWGRGGNAQVRKEEETGS